MAIHNGPDGPGDCSAQHGRCPYGASDEHYATVEEAAAAYEATMGGAVPAPAKPKPSV